MVVGAPRRAGCLLRRGSLKKNGIGGFVIEYVDTSGEARNRSI